MLTLLLELIKKKFKLNTITISNNQRLAKLKLGLLKYISNEFSSGLLKNQDFHTISYHY